MGVEWDPEKAISNLRKHGVRFSDAEAALFDPDSLSREDEDAESKQRFVSIGRDAIGRVVVVVYTYRGENVRVISVRKATRKERRLYEEGI